MNADQFLSNIRNAQDWLPGWAGRIGTRQKNSPSVPDDLVVERSGVCFVDGRDELDYLWYQLSEREGGFEYAGYRVVRLLQLSFLPLEARGDPGLLQKMRTVLRGLYGSQVNFLYLAAGIFDHQQAPVGIVQCYGVSAFANTLEEARALSLRSIARAESCYERRLPPGSSGSADGANCRVDLPEFSRYETRPGYRRPYRSARKCPRWE